MNLPALSAAIVHAIRNSPGDSNHNLATVVQGMIAEAIEKKPEPKFAPSYVSEDMKALWEKCNETIVKVVHDNNLRIEQLTEAQCTQAIIQAFQCGDFKRLVRASDGAQQVVYMPFAECEALKSEIKELREALKYQEASNDH